MLLCSTRSPRRGVTVVESAFVLPVALLLTLGLIVGGLGMYRYQEVAHLAREGARYASAHGGRYAMEGIPGITGVPAINTSQDLRDWLLPRTIILDPQQLQVDVSWTAPPNIQPPNWPSWADPDPNVTPPGSKVITNNVRVTVTYQWFPEAYLIGPITLSSTSQLQMAY